MLINKMDDLLTFESKLSQNGFLKSSFSLFDGSSLNICGSVF